MRTLLGFIGRIALGVAAVATVLIVFSPLGYFLCGPSRCMEGELYGQGHWTLSGLVGVFVFLAAILLVGFAWLIGAWVEDRAKDVKHEVDTWYIKKQLTRIPHETLEDNGGQDG